MVITKRDGTIVPFNKQKIINAINKAFLEVDGEVYEEDTAREIAEYIEDLVVLAESDPHNDYYGVEEIQDLVEEELWNSERPDVARSYTRFRHKKEIAREAKQDFINAIREKLDAADVQNQNANVDEHSFGGRTGEASGVVTKQLALDYIVSKQTRENHLNNEVYIHDLDNYYVGSHNCLSIPFDDLLANGFKTRQTDVRPAGSVNTAFQLVAVIFQLQSLQQFGGVSATHLDWTMVPYVRKSFVKHWKDGYHYIAGCSDELDWQYLEDFSIQSKHFSEKYPQVYKYAIDMTEKEVHQAVEGMYHNLKY